jgi:hypothetical protein
LPEKKMGETRRKVIDDILRDLEPVRPVRLGLLLTGLIALEIAVLAAMPGVWGWRPDLSERLADPAFLFVLTALIVAAGLSAWCALRTSVPGREVSGTRLCLLFGVPLAVALMVVSVAPWGGVWHGFGPLMDGCWGCIGVSAVTALVPWVVVVLVVARLAPLRTLRVGLFAGLSAFLVGAAVTELHCGSGDAYHLAVGHYVPIAVLALVTGIVVSACLRRRAASLAADVGLGD